MTDPLKPLDSFLHIADLHFWELVVSPVQLLNKRVLGMANLWLRRRHEFDMQRAEPFADAVAEVGIGPVVMTGDFATTATDHEMAMGAAFVSGLEGRGLSPTVIAGNHDVYTFESVRADRFERHFGSWTPDATLPAVRTLPGGTPVLFVPTVRPNYLSSRGSISDEQATRTAESLAGFESPVVVAGHYPILKKTYGYMTPANRQLRNARALHDALGQSGRTVLYVCGHVHRFSFVRDGRYPNLCHLSTGAFFRHDAASGSRGEFSEVHVRPDGFDVLRHVFTDDWSVTEAHAREESGLNLADE